MLSFWIKNYENVISCWNDVEKKDLNANYYAYPPCINMCSFVLTELKAHSILNSNNAGIFKFAT
jgi:hypothetical protein